MNCLDANVAPRREERLGTVIEYGGVVCGIEKDFCGGCMKNRSRGFSQGTICQLIPATAILTYMENAVVIVHGAVGCGGAVHSQGAAMRVAQWKNGDKNPKGILWLSTNLNIRDIVNGGEAKLRQTILEADRRYRPDAIVVISTCVPEIIGDNIDGITDDLKDQTNAVLLPVHCEGFKTKIMATAYDAIFHSFLKNLIDGKDETQYSIYDNDLEIAAEKLRRSRTVNLMNVSSMTGPDQNELIRLLNKLGLTVNMLPCDAEPDNIRYAPFSALTIGVCPTHDDYFLDHMKEIYGVPYISGQIPIGIENTNIWIRQVAAALGIEDIGERLIKSETEELKSALEPILPALKGKTAMLSAGEIRTLSTAVLLQEYGMDILAVRPYHYDQFGAVEIEKLEKINPEIRINVATAQPFEAVNIIKRVQPDVYIGHNSDGVWAAKCGAVVLPIYGNGFVYCGYAGAYDIAKRIKRHLSNNSFNVKLSQHVRQPYKEDWYEQDPFSYIKESEVII
ncbi:MAG: nitrogenase [Clostridiales Family XIII bacterium]|jgi:nitrogenase molybdenum-iron protein alpha chain|nr:nitrogenase [Clostridiales Family XIII bacterium]